MQAVMGFKELSLHLNLETFETQENVGDATQLRAPPEPCEVKRTLWSAFFGSAPGTQVILINYDNLFAFLSFEKNPVSNDNRFQDNLDISCDNS
jgi:hypothetical protein